jgi:hypothetical protein
MEPPGTSRHDPGPPGPKVLDNALPPRFSERAQTGREDDWDSPAVTRIATRMDQLGGQQQKALALLEQYSQTAAGNASQLAEALRAAIENQSNQRREIDLIKQQIEALLQNHR